MKSKLRTVRRMASGAGRPASGRRRKPGAGRRGRLSTARRQHRSTAAGRTSRRLRIRRKIAGSKLKRSKRGVLYSRSRTRRRLSSRRSGPGRRRAAKSYRTGYNSAFNIGFDTGFAKGFEDGHQLAYEQQV